MSLAGKTDPAKRLDEFLSSGLHVGFFNHMPTFLKSRANALKNLQLEHVKIETEFHKEVHELELKYAKKYLPLYTKRFEIISGQYEPSEKEATIAPPVVDYTEVTEENSPVDSRMDEIAKQFPKFTEEEEKQLKDKIKGIPGFWLGVMIGSSDVQDLIEPADHDILKYLSDIRVIYYPTASDGFTLEFHFNENPYFTNKVLTKRYFLNVEPDPTDPFCYEGACVARAEGCTIDWKEGKDPTVKVVTRRQRHKTNGTLRQVHQTVEQDSFFRFFKPPVIPDNQEEMDVEGTAMASVDFELGELFRSSLVPNAILYYTGYVDDDDGDEDEEDDDDSDESDDSQDMDDNDENDSLGEES